MPRHFMMKEIHEQPKAVEDTLNSIIKDNQIVLDLEGLDISNLSQIHFVACGSAWHVSMACQYIFEDLTHIPVRVNSVIAILYCQKKI